MDESDSSERTTVQQVFSVHSLESSEEPPMEEWSSLEILLASENKKKLLHQEGLYDPGPAELCGEYVTMSASSVFRHPYYSYPAILDPGIMDALLKRPDIITFSKDGQALYLATCKEMNQCPVRSFHRGLLEDKIDLRYYCIEPNGFRAMAMALQFNKMVKYLDLTDNFLNDDACFHMREMLLWNETITEIKLRGCRIGPQGARRLFCDLMQNKTLKTLDLSYNKLGDEGMQYLARAVLYGLNIKNLNLSYNNITGKGVEYLVESFETHNKFIQLDLSWNKIFSVGGYAFLMKLAESDCLEVLNLSWNGLSGRMGFPIKNIFFCPNLKELNLSNNRLEGEAVTTLIGGVTKAKKLITLNLSFNPMSPNDALKVLSKVAMVAAKVKIVLMDNVDVSEAFVTLLRETKLKKSKKTLVVTFGNVIGTFKPKKQDKRNLVLNRIEYLTTRSKKNKADIALIALQLQKENRTTVLNKDFITDLKNGGAVLDEDLVDELCHVFPAPSKSPKILILNINSLVDYIKQKWPERRLPPTPPEPEPEPIPEPPPKGKKGKKGKSL